MEVCRSSSLEGSQRAAEQAGRDCLQTSDGLGLGHPWTSGIQRGWALESHQEMITPDDRDDATSVLVGNLSWRSLGRGPQEKTVEIDWKMGELM